MNLTLSPGISQSIPPQTLAGAFATPGFDITSTSTGILVFNLDIPLPDQTDPTKIISAQIDWLNNGVWQPLCGVRWVGGSYPDKNGKSYYPPRCQEDVAQMAGKTVRVSGYAGDETTQTPNPIQAGATIKVI